MVIYSRPLARCLSAFSRYLAHTILVSVEDGKCYKASLQGGFHELLTVKACNFATKDPKTMHFTVPSTTDVFVPVPWKRTNIDSGTFGRNVMSVRMKWQQCGVGKLVVRQPTMSVLLVCLLP